MKRYRSAQGIIAVLVLTICRAVAQDIDPASDPNVQPGSDTSINGYVLAWSDEFNGTAVDAAKWNYREGDDSRTFVKSFQTAANNSVSGGLYRCHLKKETMGTKEFTAGGIISKNLFRYGYYESRFRVPPTGGWHTSFWMMRRNYGGSPHIELDVFENDSVDLFDYSVNTHRWKPDPHVTFGTKAIDTPSLHADFHVLGCEYTPTELRYFFNGELVQTVDATQFDHNDMNVWLTSLALVYDWQDPVDESQLPVEAQYDYVRFFELGPHATVEITAPDVGGATLADTNITVQLTATAVAVNTNATPIVVWSKRSGPGAVTFDDASSANTGARFSADGFYEVMCSAVIGNVTNSDTVVISVNAPVTVTLRHGLSGYDNPCTFIRGDYPDVNSGADNEMIIGRWGNKGTRGLLAFDLNSLDPDAVIQEAELQLYNYNGSGTIGTMELRELSASFVEGTGDGNGWSDGNGAGSGATWYSRTGSENWASAGGDFYPTTLSSMSGYNATITGVKTFSSTPAFAAAVQGALDAGQPLNLMISSPTTENGSSAAISRLRSDDASSEDQRPILTISYLGNYLPEVYAGLDLVGMTNSPVALYGTENYADAVEWSMVSGPGSVLFSDAAALSNAATFSIPGRYFLRLTGSNTRGAGYQDISISVADSRPPFKGITVSDGTAYLEINSVTGLTYMLQTTTNLLADWTELYTTNAVADPMYLEVPVSTNHAAFYQLELMP